MKYNTVYEDMFSGSNHQSFDSTLAHFLSPLSSSSSSLSSPLLSVSLLSCVYAAYFCTKSLHHVILKTVSLIYNNSCLSFSPSFSPSFCQASYTGTFVTEKNALKLSLMSVKTKQMVFLQPSKKIKRCGKELLEDSHVVAER